MNRLLDRLRRLEERLPPPPAPSSVVQCDFVGGETAEEAITKHLEEWQRANPGLELPALPSGAGYLIVPPPCSSEDWDQTYGADAHRVAPPQRRGTRRT